MSNVMKCGVGFVVLVLVAWNIGCSKGTPGSMPAPQQTETTTLPTEGNPAAEPGVEDQFAAPADGEESVSAEVQAALASLSTEDRAAALKQKICPVSGGPLGSMGAPVKVSVAGHDVFICCEHCEQPLKDDAVKHLAKIGLKPTEEAAVQ